MSNAFRRVLPSFGAALPMVVIFIAVLSIPLAVAPGLGLSTAQVTGWIVAVYGLPGLLSLALTIRYRQPLVLTGNVFALIFIASLGGQFSYAELVGASIVAGACVLLLGAFGLTNRLAAWLPAPIVFGVIGGAVLPYIAGIFTALGGELLMVGGAFTGYLASRRAFGSRLTPVLPALVAGLVIAGLTGRLGAVPTQLAWPVPAITLPDFSLHAIASTAPVLVVLITLQSNLPSFVFLRSQGYRPPERAINVISGVGTLLGAVLGPTAVSLPVPVIPLAAGPEAGEHRTRHRSVYVAAGALVLIAALAGLAVELAAIIPRPLLLALAGLALIGVLTSALQQVARGPLLLGPTFAFAISLSQLSLLGLGPFFWALFLGAIVSLLLEGAEWKALRANELTATATL